MSMKKVWIEDGCNVCDMYECNCPEVFNIKDVVAVIKGANYSD